MRSPGIKVIVPLIALDVNDGPIQAVDAAGVSTDTSLAAMYSWIRCLRVADGPDEVYRRTVTQREQRKHARRRLSDTGRDPSRAL